LVTIGQTHESERLRSLSADAMDCDTDNFRNLNFKSDIASQFKSDLQSELEKTGPNNTNFDQMMNGLNEAQLTSFVADVCSNIEMLAGKYLGR
jgi:hypothetical protein